MEENIKSPVIAFVWRFEELNKTAIGAARKTGTKIILDLSNEPQDKIIPVARKCFDFGDVIHAKIAPAQLTDKSIEDFLRTARINHFWVEINSASIEKDASFYFEKIAQLGQRFNCFPIILELNLIDEFIQNYSLVGNLVLKGSEAAGFVSNESTFTLYSAVRELTRNSINPPDLFIWGGIGTPEAAAAFLSAGAKGIVFECLHWLTNQVPLEDAIRKKIINFQPDHSEVIGSNLNVPCRLFNKGNSKAVKRLRQFAISLCGIEVRDEQRRLFANRVFKESIHPLESTFARDEIIPLGVEAAFAHAFTERFGLQAKEAIAGFLDSISRYCHQAEEKKNSFVSSPVAKEMGIRYPFIQGGMSWITDVPGFAAEVSKAGGLPTIALGMMDLSSLQKRLGNISKSMEDRPYAVNVICLPENPFLDEQLHWIMQTKPKFAVIAAGEPSHAKQLIDAGIEVIYIAPNAQLLKLAFKTGIRYAVCEGNEAGGHIGSYSTLTFSQIIQDLKNSEPEIFEYGRIILAGGICNRETAFMAAMLGADALQMGTAYLGTKEIVTTGALSELYQRVIIESKPGTTVITGESTGLRVRSLRTGHMEAVCSLEREYLSGSEEETPFRQRFEALAAGSLLLAARGKRDPNGPDVDEATCLEQGQFMSGACAGLINRVQTLKEFHFGLAESSLPSGLPVLYPFDAAQLSKKQYVTQSIAEAKSVAALPAALRKSSERERITITGMGIVNALGNSADNVWKASRDGVSGIVEVPLSKWDHSLFYDPRPRVPQKTYCKVAAFQNLEVSRKALGIAPQDFNTMTHSTRYTLWLAKQAIEASGILMANIPRERIGVFVSQNSGEAAATLSDVFIRGYADRIAASIKQCLPESHGTEKLVAEAIKAQYREVDDTTLLGRLSCTAAGFICNTYGFSGPSFAVSTACASSLTALYYACQMILIGMLDAAVIGGAEEPITPLHFLEFSALGALSGLSGFTFPAAQSSRPFDAKRDGMVLGEGGAVIVIERESLARSRGARIHGYITAMGASTNHTGMVESSRSSQVLAMRSSFKDAGYAPDSVDLIECHATATIQGDIEEFHALRALYTPDRQTVLSSLKSQIGHTLGASGLNSLIRGLSAADAGLFPPTLNFDTPEPQLNYEGSGLIIHRQSTEWKAPKGHPRRFEVNAFGFGGFNYVVQAEQNSDHLDTVMVNLSESRPPPAAPSTDSADLPKGIYCFRATFDGQFYRLAVLSESESDARQRLQQFDIFDQGQPLDTVRITALSRQGVHIGPEKTAAPDAAFVIPGQGAYYAGMGSELYKNVPLIRFWIDRLANVADFDLEHLLFEQTEIELANTRWQQPALFALEYAIARHLFSLGFAPKALAGHSLGELTALCLAGVYSWKDGIQLVDKRAQCMQKAVERSADPGIMVATDAPLETMKQATGTNDSIHVTNINSPRQVVFGGATNACSAFISELEQQGFRCTKLPVSMAFHTPAMGCIRDEMRAFMDTIDFNEPQLPVVSNTTGNVFPANPDEIKRIMLMHLETPVHWLKNIRILHDDLCIRCFVEIGPRDILSNLVADTFDDVVCIHTCLPAAEDRVYRTALAKLYISGHLSETISVGPIPPPAVRPPVNAGTSMVTTTAKTGKPSEMVIERIVHKEIDTFILDSFRRFLKPRILASLRRQLDPNYGEKELDEALARLFPADSVESYRLAPEELVPTDHSSTMPPPESASSPSDANFTDLADVTEAVIRIIMDATGYERDEIEPVMDLREDLSIRSSRLPVIMDRMESRFELSINFQDFSGVRTVADVAERIHQVLNTPSESYTDANKGIDRSGQRNGRIKPSETKGDTVPTGRFVLRSAPLEAIEHRFSYRFRNPKMQLAVSGFVGNKAL
jgi:acyl transferase domain-containing protein/NAD(P)H-dependent flavin oxidoreductase YrpB (nitropropane dioxygenase family)/acyl carrier protein